MKGKIKFADNLVEISAATAVLILFLNGTIGIGYAALGIVLSLALRWPFKTRKKHPS